MKRSIFLALAVLCMSTAVGCGTLGGVRCGGAGCGSYANNEIIESGGPGCSDCGHRPDLVGVIQQVGLFRTLGNILYLGCCDNGGCGDAGCEHCCRLFPNGFPCLWNWGGWGCGDRYYGPFQRTGACEPCDNNGNWSGPQRGRYRQRNSQGLGAPSLKPTIADPEQKKTYKPMGKIDNDDDNTAPDKKSGEEADENVDEPAALPMPKLNIPSPESRDKQTWRPRRSRIRMVKPEFKKRIKLAMTE